MQEFLSMNYEWLRALHIIAVISWMAGMLYLPRLFVYHAEAEADADRIEAFKVMERRLLKFIMNPAMIVSWILGGLMIAANPAMMSDGWIHVKLLCVVLVSALHGIFSKYVRVFASGENTKSSKFFRIINEVPTVLMIIIVIMAVVQPF